MLFELCIPYHVFRNNVYVYISTMEINRDDFILLFNYLGYFVYDYKDYFGRNRDFSLAKEYIFEVLEGMKENNMNLINPY